MPGATFRIRGLQIEGFKAFAAPQSIAIGGHVFVFGKNSLGKSSVVEAVRWCLFGLADRPEAEVRNVFYSDGDCKVELELDGPRGVWSIQRRLRPGSGRSDLVIRDPDGANVPQSSVFPHMARLGPREGTHIIFASQQVSYRRPQADITNFDRVLYSYLQIEDVPDLLNRIDRDVEEQAEVERQLAKELDDAEESIRVDLSNLRGRMEEILTASPWPGVSVPTNAETDARIRAFVKESGGSLERYDGGAVNRDWLLAEATRAIRELSAVTEEDAREQLSVARELLEELANAKQAFEAGNEKLTKANGAVDSCERDLRDSLGTTTKEQLLSERDEFARQDKQLADRVALAEQATRYLEEFLPAECPVCDVGVDGADLLSRLESRIESGVHVEAAEAPKIVKAHLETIEAVEAALTAAKERCIAAELEEAIAQEQLKRLLDDPTDLSSSERTVERLAERVRQLELEVNESGALSAAKRTALKNLQAEARFQGHRSRAERLQRNLESGIQPARDALREFADVLEALRAVREALQESFNNTLNGTLPRISELMTDVYGRLTQQTSFPNIAVESGPTDATRTLRVRVTSDRTPGESFEPSEVLNGQAFNALNLVPYFVFSQFQAEALELDCLLIDDPSQSFDTSRVELLMRELASAATHAQLIVATHEKDRFARLIERYFAPGTYRVLEVTSFDPGLGPTLEYAD